MAKVTFSRKWGNVKVQKKSTSPATETVKSAEELVREIKESQKIPGIEDYRERSLVINGLVCARCGREFAGSKRHLLTVHHKDGNHNNNPADGSNWENLCVYCHEDVHSRGILADYIGNDLYNRDANLVYNDSQTSVGSGVLAEKLQKALRKNKSEE